MTTRDPKLSLALILLCLGAGAYSSSRLLAPPATAAKSQEIQTASWMELGPGNVGGRTRVLVIHPTNPDTIYAAAASGGVWKTTDGGASWGPLTDRLSNLAVNALAVDRNNPNVIYAGTGEGFSNSDARRGVGIFKSTDGGATWTLLDGTRATDFYYVNDIVVSHSDSRRVYAATNAGVFRSFDGGATWARVLDSQSNGGCQDLAIRADQSGDSIFAGCGTYSARIFRNTDAGGAGSWTPVYFSGGLGRTRLAIAPSDQNIVYALATYNGSGGERNDAHLFGVFRSTDGGAEDTWQAQTLFNSFPPQPNDNLNQALLSNPLYTFYNECGLGQKRLENIGWYAGAIAIDPVDPNRVWVGGVDLFRSDDGGRNWGLASYWWAKKDHPHYAPANHHTIVFHPAYDGSTNKTMYVANDGGVWRTDDARAATANGSTAPCDPRNTSVEWKSLNRDFGVAMFNSGAVTPDGKTFFGGTQSQGLLRGSEAAGLNAWTSLLNGDVGQVAIDATRANVIYASAPNYINSPRIAIRKSTDGGASFVSARSGMSEVSSVLTYLSPLVMDPSDPQRLWTGGALVWRTDNGAASWAIATGSYANAVTALAIAPADANRAMVGTQYGEVLRSSEALNTVGVNWQSSLPRTGYVSGLAFDPTNEQIVYATYSTFGGIHLWKSADGGATWNGGYGSSETGLPDAPANCVAVDPTNPSRVFVGTDVGLFVSPDGGERWAVENGLPHAPVAALVFNTAGNFTSLYAFTHGRGAWRLEIGGQVCRYQLSDNSQSFNSDGGNGSVSVNAEASGCGWTAKSNESWIAITSGANGQDSGAVSFSIAPNRSIDSRVGTISIAGRSFVVKQAAFSDTTPPTINITNPTTANTFNTTLDRISLAGVAADNIGVAYVYLSIDGAFVPPEYVRVTGTTSWTTSPIPLRVGVTRLGITAFDASGNSSSATLTVTSRPPGPDDREAPSIAIIGPTTESSHTTTSNFPTIEGKASDNVAVSHVTWSNDRGGAGVAVGTTSWSVNTTQIRFGLNRLTFTAWDVNGNSGSAQITINYNPVLFYRGFAGRLFAAGFGGDGGQARSAQLFGPREMVYDAQGNLYVSDTRNHRVRKITKDGIINTIAGSGGLGNGGDGGQAIYAELNEPRGLAIDAIGNIYIADSLNHRVRRVTPAGLISTIAGTGVEGFGGDGGQATGARLNYPLGLAIDTAGNLYIADSGNHRIRKVDAQTGLISTIAGTGQTGFSGDNVPATQARLSSPVALAFDAVGNLHIADRDNNRVRKIRPNGVIVTVAGGGDPLEANGIPATQARIDQPSALAFDPAGNLYIWSGLLRRVTTDGLFYSLRIAPEANADGEAPNYQTLTSAPFGLATDQSGKVYMADTLNHRITVLTIQSFPSVATVSAASFSAGSLATEAIAAAFGANLASTSEAAASLPLPYSLAGTTVSVRDSLGAERNAPLFFVSPSQINFLIPANTWPGLGSIIVANNRGELTIGQAQINRVAPSLFTANSDGQGVPAAAVLRVKADNSRQFEPVAVFDQTLNKFVPAPIDLGPDGEQVFLILFGTGIRNLEAMRVASAQAGGASLPLSYAGPQGGFAGLDQVNALLPRALAGRGDLDLNLIVEGKSSNPVQIKIK